MTATSAPRSEMKAVLVVDDERTIRKLLQKVLEKAGYRVGTAANGVEALSLLQGQQFHVAIVDLNMPKMGGLELIRNMAVDFPEVVPIVLTAYASLDSVVEAMRHGAFDFMQKPLESPDALEVVVAKALRHRSLTDQASLATEDTSEPLYADPSMARVYAMVDKVAPTSVTVLVLGESGTGKEMVARTLHAKSARSDRPFVAINCAALTETLLESELFGHEKGAFTGATARKRGKFEVADGGTLFLDEVGEMSPSLQAKLLRVLQEQSFERVGGTTPLTVDVRIIAATNRDLQEMIRAGRFREDLYYRLAVMPITVPPLRLRPGDITPLALRFLGELSRKHGKPALELSADALEALSSYGWPGNVRELMNVIERAVILTDGPTIDRSILLLPDRSPSHAEPLTFDLKEIEQRTIVHALEHTAGNRRQAADLLGLGLRTLQYKLKEMGLTER